MAILNLIFSALLTGFGAFGLANQLREFSRARQSRRWPKSEAVVTTCTVHERRGSRGRTTFEPTVEYRYTFGEHAYLGQRLAFGELSSPSRADATRVADRFGVGTRWEVSVNERRPEISVLHPGPTGRLWFGLVFFVGYVCFATAFLIDALGRLR